MGLAGTWETPDGEPTMTFFIILGGALTLAVIGVVLFLRWHDRRQQLRDGLPWRRLITQNREIIDQARHALERHEQIISQRGQWLADQVTEHGEQLASVESAVGEICAYVVEAYGMPAPRPRLKVIKGG